MIKKILFIFCFFLLHIANAQQLPISQQNYLNTFSLQPAFTGHVEGLNTWVSFRKNLLNYSGAPNTIALNVSYRNSDKHGLGGNFNTDQSGLFRNTSLNFSYAYRLKIKATNYISAGFSSGFTENRFDFASISLEDKTDIGALSNNGKLMWNVGFGLAYMNKRLILGVGLPILYSTNVKYRYSNTDFSYQLRQQKIVNISYAFNITKLGKIQIIPIIILRNQPNKNWVNDFVATIRYDKRFSLTTGYRNTGLVPVVLALEIKKNFNVFYGQEIAVGNLSNYIKGGFEIGLSYKFSLRNGREHKLEDQQKNTQLDSLNTQLSLLKDTLQQKSNRLIEYENVNDNNEVLQQEVEKLRQQLAVKELEKHKISETLKEVDLNFESNSKNEISGRNTEIKIAKEMAERLNIEEGKGYFVILESSINLTELEKDVLKWQQKEASIFIIKSAKSKWYFIAISKHDNLESSLEGLKVTRLKYRKAWVVKQ